MERHELSKFWGDAAPEIKMELVEDIRKRGVLEPVTTYQGKILDGYHRFMSARSAGVDCPTVEYTGDDPAGFVIAKNAMRRNLMPSGRAAAVLRCRQWAPVGHNEREVGSSFELPTAQPADSKGDARENPPPATEKQMAKEAQVSVSTLKREKKKIKNEGKPAGGRPEKKPEAPPKQSPTARLQIQVAELQADNTNKDMQIQSLESQVRQLTKKSDATSLEELKNAHAEIAVLRKQVAEWQGQCREHRQQIAAMKSADKKSGKADIPALSRQNQGLMAEVDRLTKENVRLKRQLMGNAASLLPQEQGEYPD